MRIIYLNNTYIATTIWKLCRYSCRIKIETWCSKSIVRQPNFLWFVKIMKSLWKKPAFKWETDEESTSPSDQTRKGASIVQRQSAVSFPLSLSYSLCLCLSLCVWYVFFLSLSVLISFSLQNKDCQRQSVTLFKITDYCNKAKISITRMFSSVFRCVYRHRLRCSRY